MRPFLKGNRFGARILPGFVAVIAGAALLVAIPAAAAQIGFWPQRGSAQRQPLSGGYLADGTVHSFYFTRAMYQGYRGKWLTDYPKADRQFLAVLIRLTGVDASPFENTVALDDPELRRFPFLYTLEVGDMALSDAEVQGLRSYLLAGGFLAIDDFWGESEWRNFEREIKRVLPEYDIVDLPLDHEIFSTYYKVDELIQVPNVTNGERGGPTWENGGRVPHVRGIFDEKGRLMVIINWNTDLGDAWEWAEDPYYPLQYSTYAYQMGANFLIYSMTH